MGAGCGEGLPCGILTGLFQDALALEQRYLQAYKGLVRGEQAVFRGGAHDGGNVRFYANVSDDWVFGRREGPGERAGNNGQDNAEDRRPFVPAIKEKVQPQEWVDAAVPVIGAFDPSDGGDVGERIAIG